DRVENLFYQTIGDKKTPNNCRLYDYEDLFNYFKTSNFSLSELSNYMVLDSLQDCLENSLEKNKNPCGCYDDIVDTYEQIKDHIEDAQNGDYIYRGLYGIKRKNYEEVVNNILKSSKQSTIESFIYKNDPKNINIMHKTR